MKKFLIASIIIIVLAAIWFFFFRKGTDPEQEFTFVDVTRGDLVITITSTGTLEALSTVEVGTQVSGIIDQIYVDFNYNVRKGQLLAMVDTTSLAASVRDQQASLLKAKAEYNNAVKIHQSNIGLHDKGFISDLDFIASQTAVETATANLESAESSLERAKTNLSYALIRSPINGKVINRNVEKGQTVAASFSTPTLFTIAENLSKMRILANVDESDIGQIKVGQDVDFTVQSFNNKTFHGKVDQIRLSPQTVQNVVNYIVVVNATNDDGLLLPGMTATVDFYINKLENVLLVPNAALRFKPTTEMITKMNPELAAKLDSLNKKQGVRDTTQRNNGTVGTGTSSGKRKPGVVRLWYLDAQKRLAILPIQTGLTDGKQTEIKGGKNLQEGMKVISGTVTGTASTSGTSITPPLGGRRPF